MAWRAQSFISILPLVPVPNVVSPDHEWSQSDFKISKFCRLGSWSPDWTLAGHNASWSSLAPKPRQSTPFDELYRVVASELANSLQILSNDHFLNFSLKSQKTSRVETVTSESIKSGLTQFALLAGEWLVRGAYPGCQSV